MDENKTKGLQFRRCPMYWNHGSRLNFLLADAFSRTAIMPAERQMFPFEIKSLHLLILQSISFIGLETLISYGGKPHLITI